MMLNWPMMEGMLAIALTLGSGLPSCSDVSLPPISSQASPSVTAQAETPDDAVEQAIFEQINTHRQAQGLTPLIYSTVIADQSQQHSATMAQQSRLSHDGFEQRVAAIAQSIPYRGAGENVASNQGYSDPAAQAVVGWLNSAGHRQNIEGDFDLTGIGVVQAADGTYYLTQIFVRSR